MTEDPDTPRSVYAEMLGKLIIPHELAQARPVSSGLIGVGTLSHPLIVFGSPTDVVDVLGVPVAGFDHGRDLIYFSYNLVDSSPDRWLYDFRSAESHSGAGTPVDDVGLESAFAEFVRELGQDEDRILSNVEADPRVGAALEAFALGWLAIAESLPLPVEDQRVGEALAQMMAHLAKVEDPPQGVLRKAVDWFAPRVNLFADEFAKTAGKAAAVGTGAGVALATQRLPQLRDLLEVLARSLG